MPVDAAVFRRGLLRWYDRNARSLPWRVTGGEAAQLWPVLVSEFMLQQTRVEAVIPFFERFLTRFPGPAALAHATEADVLTAWSGLGYYSRARNLQRAAAVIAKTNPTTFEQVRALPGVGPYTAAAVSSIALDLPFAAVDGNVLRVLARITADPSNIAAESTRRRFRDVAQDLLAPDRPGDFNQAMMELGATVCVPRAPRCLLCPVSPQCAARQLGSQNELPVKSAKPAPTDAESEVVVIQRGGRVLLKQRSAVESRMAGFWELPHPSDLPGVVLSPAATFRHTIVNTRFTVAVFTGKSTAGRKPRGLTWVKPTDLATIPLTTITRKALARGDTPSALLVSEIRLRTSGGQ